MPPLDSHASSLYSAFNISQMRELALAAKVKSDIVARIRSSKEGHEALDAVTDKPRLALLAHRVEALTPYKHCVLVESSTEFTYGEVLASARANLPATFNGFVPIESDSTELVPQLCIADETTQKLYVKFAHIVAVWENSPSPDNQQIRTRARRRHIIVASIDSETRFVSITFPGFTQATVGNERVTYNTFAAQVSEYIGNILSLRLNAFNIKPATDLIIEDKEEGVLDLRRTLRFRRGGRMELDSESDEDAASALALGLANAGLKVSAADLRAAFRLSEAHSVVLLWQKLRLITRISMRQSLPEILFVWGESEPSLTLVDQVLKRLADARSLVGSDGLRGANRYIAEAALGEIIRPSWVSQNFNIAQEAAVRLLLDACSKMSCQPRFRLRADLEEQFTSRRWVSSIEMLSRELYDTKSTAIDVLRPENIEVGFERVNA